MNIEIEVDIDFHRYTENWCKNLLLWQYYTNRNNSILKDNYMYTENIFQYVYYNGDWDRYAELKEKGITWDSTIREIEKRKYFSETKKIKSSYVLKKISNEKSFSFFTGIFFKIQEVKKDEKYIHLISLQKPNEYRNHFGYDSDKGSFIDSEIIENTRCFCYSYSFNKYKFGYDLLLPDGREIFYGVDDLPLELGESVVKKYWCGYET